MSISIFNLKIFDFFTNFSLITHNAARASIGSIRTARSRRSEEGGRSANYSRRCAHTPGGHSVTYRRAACFTYWCCSVFFLSPLRSNATVRVCHPALTSREPPTPSPPLPLLRFRDERVVPPGVTRSEKKRDVEWESWHRIAWPKLVFPTSTFPHVSFHVCVCVFVAGVTRLRIHARCSSCCSCNKIRIFAPGSASRRMNRLVQVTRAPGALVFCRTLALSSFK